MSSEADGLPTARERILVIVSAGSRENIVFAVINFGDTVLTGTA